MECPPFSYARRPWLTSRKYGATSLTTTSPQRTLSPASSTTNFKHCPVNPAWVARPELAAELRSLPVGKYTIFYLPLSNGVQIVRVLHGARDIDAIFQDEA
jgi:hypothetical protein